MKLLRSSYFTPGLHVFIWVLLLGIPSVLLSGGGNFLGLSHNFFLLASIYHIGVFYFNACFLYPKLLNKKWWWLYIPAIAATIVLSYYLKLVLLHLDPGFVQTRENTRVIFFGILPFIIGSMLYRLIVDRLRFERLEKEARAERLAAELKYLRSQVSPHFLFNMLTNMVSLARHKSDLLEPSLIKLSELLRYMLYDSGDQKIPVSREIEHLENYIALQQLRFGDDIATTVSIENSCPDCTIEPMLLVPFIENAFKHGAGVAEGSRISIKLAVRNQLLDFTISNNYNPVNFSKDKNSGIGLVNVKNRLALLYPEKYHLTISDKNEVFLVHLNLDLS